MNEYPILDESEGLPLFYPHVPNASLEILRDTLSGRWIGQGPKVDEFESRFKEIFLGDFSPLAVGSGTDALHIAYILAGINAGDEVLTPVFTCTATNIPLLYLGAKPIFLDIDPISMNISVEDLKRKITDKTKAVVCVDYGGIPCEYDEIKSICSQHQIPLISDCAHSIGSIYKGKYSGQIADFSIFSFQAIKSLTTGDGGLLSIRNGDYIEKAKRLRWFGIDRSAKQKGLWENDITEVGFKYQMNDIAASIGLAGLNTINEVIALRNKLFASYESNLHNIPGVSVVGKSKSEVYYNSSWLMTVLVDGDRLGLMRKLREAGIESAQVHYRNDRYSIFGARSNELPNMDLLEERYLVLPLHTRMDESHVGRVCEFIRSGW